MEDLADNMPLSYYSGQRSGSNSSHRSHDSQERRTAGTPGEPVINIPEEDQNDQTTSHGSGEHRSQGSMRNTTRDTAGDTAGDSARYTRRDTTRDNATNPPRDTSNDHILASMQRHIFRLENRCTKLETDLMRVSKEASNSLIFVSKLLQKIMKNETTLRADITSVKSSQLKIDVKNVHALTKRMKEQGYYNVQNDAEYIIVSRNIPAMNNEQIGQNNMQERAIPQNAPPQRPPNVRVQDPREHNRYRNSSAVQNLQANMQANVPLESRVPPENYSRHTNSSAAVNQQRYNADEVRSALNASNDRRNLIQQQQGNSQHPPQGNNVQQINQAYNNLPSGSNSGVNRVPSNAGRIRYGTFTMPSGSIVRFTLQDPPKQAPTQSRQRSQHPESQAQHGVAPSQPEPKNSRYTPIAPALNGMHNVATGSSGIQNAMPGHNTSEAERIQQIITQTINGNNRGHTRNEPEMGLQRTDQRFIEQYKRRVAAKEAVSNSRKKLSEMKSASLNNMARVHKPNWQNQQTSGRIVEARPRRRLLGEGTLTGESEKTPSTDRPPIQSPVFSDSPRFVKNLLGLSTSRSPNNLLGLSTSRSPNNLLGLSTSRLPGSSEEVGNPTLQSQLGSDRDHDKSQQVAMSNNSLSNPESSSGNEVSSATTIAEHGNDPAIQSSMNDGNLLKHTSNADNENDSIDDLQSSESSKNSTPSGNADQDFDMPDAPEQEDETHQSENIIEISDTSSDGERPEETSESQNLAVKSAQLVMAGPSKRSIPLYQVDNILYTGDSPYSAMSLIFYIDQKYSDIREKKRKFVGSFRLGFPHILLDECDSAVQTFGGNIMTTEYLKSLEYFIADFLAQCHLIEDKLMPGCSPDQWRHQHEVFMALMYWRQLSKEKRGYRRYTMLHAIKEFENYRLHTKNEVSWLSSKYSLNKKSFLKLCEADTPAAWMYKVDEPLPIIGQDDVDENNINSKLDNLLTPPPGLTHFPYASVTPPEGIEVI